MIINGSGGTGKSVLINTIVHLMKTMFNDNNVIKVLAPTGSAEFNVGGETTHHCLKQGVSEMKYTPGSMKQCVTQELNERFKHLLALTIDDRSPLSSKLFGTTAQKTQETTH